MGYNFAVVGVQKGGTSTLAVTLNQHRLVCQAPDKERHYFDDETVDWSSPDYERDYTAPRRAAVHRLLGDASPTYLYWPHAMERMRAYKPDMPLIAVFRDPLERLFSHWVMLRSRNLAWPDWPDFLTEWPHTSLPDAVPDDVRTMRWRHMTGIARGFYGEQLQRGLELFGRQQWLLLELTSPGWRRSTRRTSTSSRSCPASTPPRGRPGSSSTARWTPASLLRGSRGRCADAGRWNAGLVHLATPVERGGYSY